MENDLHYSNQQIIMFKLRSFQSGLSSAGVKQCKQCVFDTRCLLVLTLLLQTEAAKYESKLFVFYQRDFYLWQPRSLTGHKTLHNLIFTRRTVHPPASSLYFLWFVLKNYETLATEKKKMLQFFFKADFFPSSFNKLVCSHDIRSLRLPRHRSTDPKSSVTQ